MPSGLDRIFIRDLRARCAVGVTPEERAQRQEIVVNAVLEADLRAAVREDRVSRGLNYKTVNRRLLQVLQRSECHLIETLAERLAAACLEFAAVQRVTVTVDKPGALRGARSVAVEITRERAHELGA